MIAALAQAAVREALKASAREQAFTDCRGVRGLPMRLDGFPYTEGENTDLTVVFDAVDQADSLVWAADEVTLMVRGDYLRHVRITRGDDVQADVFGSSELDAMLQLARGFEAGGGALTAAEGGPSGETTGEVAGWAVTCPPRACGLSGDLVSWPEAVHLAGVHDGLHHGGSPTAAIAASPAHVPALPVSRPPGVGGLVWEVDGPDGVALYRGADLELAEELYHSSPAGSHLLPVAAAPFPCPPALTAASGGGQVCEGWERS